MGYLMKKISFYDIIYIVQERKGIKKNGYKNE